MKTLVSKNFIFHFSPQLSPSNSLFYFPSISRGNLKSLRISRRNWICVRQDLKFSFFRGVCWASNSTSYGGWGDLQFVGDSDKFGESTQLRKFLASLGIDDRKYVIVFLLGIICALAIARVRVSTIFVFPASVIVFAVGFSVGFVRSGSVNEISGSQSKMKFKDENFSVYVKKLSYLLDFFDDFDVKLNNLRDNVKGAKYTEQIAISDLEDYIRAVDSISSSALNAKKVVEDCNNGIAVLGNVEDSNVELVENQKPSKRRKELGRTGFDLFKLFGGLFGENFSGSKPHKMKDGIKHGAMEMDGNNQTQGNILEPAVGEKFLDSINSKGKSKVKLSQCTLNNPVMNQDNVEKLNDTARSIKVISEIGKRNSLEMANSAKRLIESETYTFQNSRLQFMNNDRISLNMGDHNSNETRASCDSLLDSVDFRISLKRMKTGASLEQEEMLGESCEAYFSSQIKENNQTCGYSHRDEKEYLEDDSHLENSKSGHKGGVGYSSSSMVSDDVLFDKYLTEANNLLKLARECLRSGGDEERADVALYKSAELLSKAIAMKPMSLLAVGLLGNTYLLHGELKLKISRELRAHLSRRDPVSFEKWGNLLKGLGNDVSSKDKIASLLANICEECEEFLIAAGRKYRMAISIDGNDMRALYNWGLALSFRAQLIADIGPGAAYDADKVFLAAIDKFDAMMSKGNEYAPEALFRWGIALQQRSRLRPSKSKEKMKLLQQAKRLYEDALDIDSENLQVREALSSCMSELNFRHF